MRRSNRRRPRILAPCRGLSRRGAPCRPFRRAGRAALARPAHIRFRDRPGNPGQDKGACRPNIGRGGSPRLGCRLPCRPDVPWRDQTGIISKLVSLEMDHLTNICRTCPGEKPRPAVTIVLASRPAADQQIGRSRRRRALLRAAASRPVFGTRRAEAACAADPAMGRIGDGNTHNQSVFCLNCFVSVIIN